MKLSKKIGCVLLSVLMLVTSLSAGFSAVAADAQYDRLIDAIKDGQTDLDPTYDYYVKDLTNYTVQNVSDQWSTEGNTLGYRHVVTAKDNLKNTVITAPQGGLVGVTAFTQGNYITPSSGTLLTIIQVQPIRVRFRSVRRIFFPCSAVIRN